MNKEQLENFIKNELTKPEKRFLAMYYCEDKTIEEIAVALGMPESSVSELHSSLIAKLKPMFGQGDKQEK